MLKRKTKYGKRITGKEENHPATVVVVAVAAATAAVCIQKEVVVLDVLTPRCFSTVWVGVVWILSSL